MINETIGKKHNKGKKEEEKQSSFNGLTPCLNAEADGGGKTKLSSELLFSRNLFHKAGRFNTTPLI